MFTLNGKRELYFKNKLRIKFMLMYTNNIWFKEKKNPVNEM